MVVGSERLPDLLETHLAEDELVRLAFGSYARITQGTTLALMRNKGAWIKQRKVIYAPIGGGVAIPQASMAEIEKIGQLPKPVWDRKVIQGSIDLRVRLGRKALPAALEWASQLPDGVCSPIRELHEELVDEEGLLTHSEVDEIGLTRLGYYSELKRWRLPNKINTTFHVYQIWDAQLPLGAMQRIRGEQSKIIWTDEASVHEGIVAQTIGSNALALFHWQPSITIPHAISEFVEV